MEGLVERNGIFWIENVPLSGVNTITLAAKDGSGTKPTQTTFTLNPGTIVVTIDNTPADLYATHGTANGMVSDPDAVVTVNDVPAVVSGTMNWDGNGSRGCSLPMSHNDCSF